MTHSTARAKTATWNTVTRCTVYGENWGTERHTVTLTRDAQGTLTAEVDGQPALLARAVGILEGATTVSKIDERYLEVQAAPIGKARAHKLHKLMGVAGIPSREHYAFASMVLECSVYSLAELTEPEARAVWRFVQATHQAVAA